MTDALGVRTRMVKELLPRERKRIEGLLAQHGLTYEGTPECTVLIEDLEEKIVATASIEGCVIKMVAADPEWEESGLAAAATSKIIQYARENGIFHLFLYTKPDMALKFASIGFRELARTDSVVLMESGQPSAEDYRKMLESIKFPSDFAPFGAAVVNCNPFTLGHRYLIETASKMCGALYVIVVQEDASVFPFKDRIRLVSEGVRDLTNVKVLPSAGYAVSKATFPTYFLKDRGLDAIAAVQAELDVTLFANLFVPALELSMRFVGTEPFCGTTEAYNNAMKKILPAHGVKLIEIPRINDASGIPVSASRVRKALKDKDCETLKMLLPPVTLEYLISQDGMAVADKLRSEKTE